MNEKVNRIIDDSREEYTETLRRWVQIPSVRGEAEEGAPFGREVRNMLDRAMADAEAMGFEVRNVDGYACDVTLGGAEEKIAVLGHLDVVPAGDGWSRPPFGAETEDGKMYGRGTGDDKGPALASLFAMKAIREAGIPLRRSIRLILGCDEESGWEDMAYYQTKYALPEVGFSPDASFPVINTEKGMLHFAFSAPACETGLRVLRMENGQRLNVIPGDGWAVLDGDETLLRRIHAWSRRTGLPVAAEMREGGVRVTAKGIGGHSAYPEGRMNAIGILVRMFADLGEEGPMKTLASAVGMTFDGSGLGCCCEDGVSGPLTCNMGLLRLESGVWKGTLDLRCPVTADLEELKRRVKEHLPGFTVELTEEKAPHHVPADSELVRAVLAAYEEETGLKGEPESTGGGTYAKVLKQGVAFGAQFPDQPDLAHQPDEYVEIDRMLLAAKIYANTLIRLAAE